MLILFNRINQPREFARARTELLNWLNSDQNLSVMVGQSGSELTANARSWSETWLDDAWQGGGFGGYTKDDQSGAINSFCYFELGYEDTEAYLAGLITAQSAGWQETLQPFLIELLRTYPNLSSIGLTRQAGELLTLVRQISQDEDWQASDDNKWLILEET